MTTVRRVTSLTDSQIHELVLVLIDCVEGGASVSFMHPLSLEKLQLSGVGSPRTSHATRAR